MKPSCVVVGSYETILYVSMSCMCLKIMNEQFENSMA